MINISSFNLFELIFFLNSVRVWVNYQGEVTSIKMPKKDIVDDLKKEVKKAFSNKLTCDPSALKLLWNSDELELESFIPETERKNPILVEGNEFFYSLKTLLNSLKTRDLFYKIFKFTNQILFSKKK